MDPLEQFDTNTLEKCFAKYFSFFTWPETSDQITSNITVSFFILGLISYYTLNIITTRTYNMSIYTFIIENLGNLLTSFFKNYNILTIKYGIFIVALFYIILLSNLLSLIIPTGETSTAHIIINFTLSFISVISMALYYIHSTKLNFFSVFVLQGVPLVILPFLLLIETISYLARLISLAVRLFANITAGHVLVSLFSFVLLKLITTANLLSLIVIPFFLAILILEFLVAFLQTYVFTVLLNSYLEEFEHHI